MNEGAMVVYEGESFVGTPACEMWFNESMGTWEQQPVWW